MRLIIKGTVQGVGFRPTVYRVAHELGLNGFVKNKGSEVEIVLDREHEYFIEDLKKKLPPLAKIDDIQLYQEDYKGKGFHIVPSEEGARTSTIPVDTALCDDCLLELTAPDDRRWGYPFINCTNCGARYSAITGLPYDRPKTTMSPFSLCKTCSEEYNNPIDRRFHAQTTSCPDCGPKYILFDKQKNKIGSISEFAILIQEGNIGVAKSWGGMHIICTLDSIPELRERYGRAQKPFALMVKDLESARRYAHITREDVFNGPRKPIMIYPKKEYELLEDAAPGLPNVGLMLPYTGLHHLLFQLIPSDLLVMTSANIPGEPMLIKNEEAFELKFDYFLLHDRDIAQRIDDSLIRVHGNDLAPIRRSRGYVPEHMDFPSDSTIFAAGADQGGCMAFSINERLYPSQYLGNLDSYEANISYRDTFEHLSSILGIEKIKTVAVDMHPGYQSRKLGLEIADRYQADTVEIQHHWAHGASLLLEHDLDDIVCIAVDGTGYGEDGTSWGGEVLYCTADKYERRAHLEPFTLLGGEKAIMDPKRLVYAIQRSKGLEGSYFYDETAEIFDKLMEEDIKTTSFGRLLDAVSAALDICHERTYEGEPAMKLERLLLDRCAEHRYDIYQKGDTIYTLDGFIEMLYDDISKEHRASSYVKAVSRGLAEAASDVSDSCGSPIGISGGVSYNEPIVRWIRERLEELGHRLLVHEKIPNGDMGISAGQALIASKT